MDDRYPFPALFALPRDNSRPNTGIYPRYGTYRVCTGMYQGLLFYTRYSGCHRGERVRLVRGGCQSNQQLPCASPTSVECTTEGIGGWDVQIWQLRPARSRVKRAVRIGMYVTVRLRGQNIEKKKKKCTHVHENAKTCRNGSKKVMA